MKVKDYLSCHQKWCKGVEAKINGEYLSVKECNNKGVKPHRVCLEGAVRMCYNGEIPEHILKKLLVSLQKITGEQHGCLSTYNDDAKMNFATLQKALKAANV